MKCSRWSLVSPSYATMYESTSNATPPPTAAAAAAPFVAGAAAAPSSTLMALDDAAMAPSKLPLPLARLSQLFVG